MQTLNDENFPVNTFDWRRYSDLMAKAYVLHGLGREAESLECSRQAASALFTGIPYPASEEEREEVTSA